MEQKHTALYSGISYSYITVVESYLKVLKNPIYTSFTYLDTPTEKLLQEIKTLFLSLPSLLDASSDFKETYTDQIMHYRSTLENSYQALTAYKRELEHLSSLRNLQHVLSSGAEDYSEFENDMDFEALAHDAMHFVFNSHSLRERQSKASAILPYVPMRMTRTSYLDYIKQSLYKISIPDSKEEALRLCTILNQIIDGKHYSLYGQVYQDIAVSIEELQAIEDSEVFFEEADLLNETLDYMIDTCSNLYHMLLALSNLLIFDALTFESLTDLHVSFYDLYCSVKNILERSEDGELFLETLPERVLMIKEEIQKNYKKMQTKETLDPLFKLIQTQLLIDIDFVFGFDASEHPAYSEAVCDVFDTFIEELKVYLNHQPIEERKCRMQYFISMMPFIMSKEQFESYLKHGFEEVVSSNRRILGAAYIAHILNESGYFDSPTEHHSCADPTHHH